MRASTGDGGTVYYPYMVNHRRFVLIVLVSILVPASLFAVDWENREIIHSQTLAASMNPLGLSLASKLALSVPLYQEMEGVLWDSAKVEIGAINRFTPAFDDVGAELYVEPIAVADVRTRVVFRQMFELFGNGYTPLEGPDVNYGPNAVLAQYNRTGWMVEIVPRFKVAFGQFVAFDSVTFRRVEMREMGSETGWFYEPLADAPQENGDWQIGNTAAILWDTPWIRERGPRQLLFGLDYSLMTVDMDDPEWQRLSLMTVWSAPDLFGETGPGFSIAGLLGGHLSHPYYDVMDGEVYVAVQAGVTWRY